MEDKQKKEVVRQDRILLKGEALDRVNRWSVQVCAKVPQAKISHSALLHWLVMAHPESLSESELDELGRSFHDDLRYAKWLVRQIEISRAKGEKTDLKSLMEKDLLQKENGDGR